MRIISLSYHYYIIILLVLKVLFLLFIALISKKISPTCHETAYICRKPWYKTCYAIVIPLMFDQ